MRRVDDTAVSFARACEAARAEYALIRGIAVIAWGQPRTTQDVDTLLSLDDAVIERLVPALRAEGLEVNEADLRDAARAGGHATVFDAGAQFHIDIRPARTAAERDQIRHAIAIEFKGQRVRVARPEDTVAFKLKFGSPQDVQDARSILIRQEGRLDLGRLRDLARRLDVENALDDLLKLG